jgi:uncharacterized Fe-S cluster protein YjdI
VSARLHVYEGADVTVTFDASRCIHHAHCVSSLPAVFNTAARPWVQPDNANAATVLAVVAGCPTGALHAVYRTEGNADADRPDVDLVVQVTRDGPLFVRGVVQLVDGTDAVLAEDDRVALCRCGLSKRKPFCDNSHRAAGWRESPAAG